jgi:uncharacterized membrane protein
MTYNQALEVDMFIALRKIHRFLYSQAFYPITLSSIMAVAFFIGRVIFSLNDLIYRNLLWNLFLAWIPYLFSIAAIGLHLAFPKHWWPLLIPGGIWLVFFPNAPYILTDFLHLSYRPPVPLWYDIGLLASFAWSGLFLAVASLKTMHELVKTYLGWVIGWLFSGAALGLGGLGLYLGRFSRWNSWDLLSQPQEILFDIARRLANPLDNLRFFGFTLMFTAILLVCYLTFISLQHVQAPDKS